jgi:hypothetical protein
MQNAMLFHPTQLTLVNVFQLSKHIELNMVEECVVIIEFSKDKTRNSSTPLTQQTTWPSQ